MKLSENNRFNTNCYWIEAEFDISDCKKVAFNLTEKPGSEKKVIVGYDAGKQLFSEGPATVKNLTIRDLARP